MNPTEKQINRFWSRVIKSDRCWEWTGAQDQDGYGNMAIFKVFFKTHRFAYLISVGSIPEGMKILHRCDNPRCVRPEHLFAGTQKENVHDMMRKGRENRPLGERSKWAKITNEKAATIRSRILSGEPVSQIAKSEKLSYGSVYSIKTKRAWRWLK